MRDPNEFLDDLCQGNWQTFFSIDFDFSKVKKKYPAGHTYQNSLLIFVTIGIGQIYTRTKFQFDISTCFAIKNKILQNQMRAFASSRLPK